jgi:structural maintenance of chromosome 1
MDAISFVLGVKSSQLRGSQLKELIYKGDSEYVVKSCYVKCRYQAEDSMIEFQRKISMAGSSEYSIDGKPCTYENYSRELETHGILIKSKNFLVFQGHIETIASQSPKDLTHLIEQISGSLELKAEYDRLKALQEKASEASALNFTKKKTMNNEIKAVREQKEETLRFKRLQNQKDELVRDRHMYCKLSLGANCIMMNKALQSSKRRLLD